MLAEGEGPYAGPIRSTDVRRGRDRYFVVCGPCHEHDQLAPPLFDLAWSAAEVRHQIREGNALMPPIRPARLTDADIETLLSYLVTIGTVREEFAAVEAEVPEVDPAEPPSPAGSDPPSEGTASEESSVDGEVGLDAGVDASVEDASIDAGIDASVDASIDASVDVDDPGVDGGAIDAAAIDAGAFDVGAVDADAGVPP
jgi:hypothetical protein